MNQFEGAISDPIVILFVREQIARQGPEVAPLSLVELQVAQALPEELF
jgi:hypothetical protein